MKSLVAAVLFLTGCVQESAPAPATPAPQVEESRPKRPRQPEFAQTASDRDEAIAAAIAGYTQDGTATQTRLEDFGGMQMTLKRGHCYVLVMKFGEGTVWEDHTTRGVSIHFVNGDRDYDVMSGHVVGPGVVASAGCPQANSLATFRIDPLERPQKGHDELGTGDVELRVYSKPVSNAGLAKAKANEDRDIADQRAMDARDAARKNAGCNKCERKYLECLAAHRVAESRCKSDREFCATSETGGTGCSFD